MARSKAVANLSVSLTARTSAFSAGLKKARGNLASFSKSVAATAASVGRRAAGIGTALAGVGTGIGISKSLKAIDNLQKSARKLKTPAAQILGIRDAFEFAGVAGEEADRAMLNLSRRLSEASKGLGEAKDAFKELGIDAGALARARADEQFAAISDAFTNIASQSDRVRLAMKVFEESGASLLNVFESISGGGSGAGFADAVAEEMNAAQRHAARARARMEAMTGRPLNAPTFGRTPGANAMAEITRLAEAARKAGRVTTEAQGRAAESALDAVKRLGDNLAGVFTQAAAKLAPTIENVAKRFADFIIAGDLAGKLAGAMQTVVAFFESRFFAALSNVVANVFNRLDELIPWEKIKTGFTEALEFAATAMQSADNMKRAAEVAGAFARETAINAIPGARGAVAAAGRLGQARDFWIDNVAENLLTSANLTGSAARGLDAAGNALGLGPVGSDMLKTLRNIERNTANFVAGAVAQ